MELLAEKSGEGLSDVSHSLLFDAAHEGDCVDFKHPIIDFTCGTKKNRYTKLDLGRMTPWLSVTFFDKIKSDNALIPFSTFFPDTKKTGHIMVSSCGIPTSAKGSSAKKLKVALNVYRKLIFKLKVKIPPAFEQKVSLESKHSVNKSEYSSDVNVRVFSNEFSTKQSLNLGFKDSRLVSTEQSSKTSYNGITSASKLKYKNDVIERKNSYEVKDGLNSYKIEKEVALAPGYSKSTVKTTSETGLIFAKQTSAVHEKGYSDLAGNTIQTHLRVDYLEINQKSALEQKYNKFVKEDNFVKDAAAISNDCIEFTINDKTPKVISFISALYNLKKDLKKFVNDLQGLVPAIGFKVTFNFILFDGTLEGEWGKRHDNYFDAVPYACMIEDYWSIYFKTVLFGFTLEVFCGLDLEVSSPKLLATFFEVKTLFALKAGITISLDYAFKIDGTLGKSKQDISYPNLISEFTLTIVAELKLVILNKSVGAKVVIEWRLGEKFFFEKKSEAGQRYFSVNGVDWFASKEALLIALETATLNIDNNGDKITETFDGKGFRSKGGLPDPAPDAYPSIAGSIQPKECTLDIIVNSLNKGAHETKKQKPFKTIVLTEAKKAPVWEGTVLG